MSLVYDMPEADYHGHKGSLSQSGAKLMLSNPALYRWRQDNPQHSDAFDLGTTAHTLLLGGTEPVVVDADSWRTKAAAEVRDAARAEGRVALLAKDYERAEAMAAAVLAHPQASVLLAGGEKEVSAFATHEPTGVMRRARLDVLHPDLIVDVKTTISAERSAFAKSCAKFGYAMQAAWYKDVARALGYDVRGFVFVVVEKDPPHFVECYELDEPSEDRGRELAERALERFRDCTESGIWPGYTTGGIHSLSLPRWAFYDQETNDD